MKIKLAGIYMIEVGEYYYIGYSIDIFSRFSSHYNNMVINKHSSPELTRSLEKWGIEGFTFRVLEYVSLTEFKKLTGLKGKNLENGFRKYLIAKEKEWMRKYSINFSLNKDNKHFS